MFTPFLDDLASERLCVAHLDDRLQLLDLTICAVGNDSAVNVPLRRIMADALRLDARAFILAHNHPRGNPTPSEADKQATRRIVEVARELGIRVLDHLVFAGGEVTSFRALSLL